MAAIAASGIATNTVTVDQYMAVALPGRMFRREVERRGYANVVCSPTPSSEAPS